MPGYFLHLQSRRRENGGKVSRGFKTVDDKCTPSLTHTLRMDRWGKLSTAVHISFALMFVRLNFPSTIKESDMDAGVGQIFMNKASLSLFYLIPSSSSTFPIPQSICFGGGHPLIKSLSFHFYFPSFCIIYLPIHPQLWRAYMVAGLGCSSFTFF